VTLTPEMGKVLTALTQVHLKGRCHFVNAVQVGQLALKHRQNKSQRQRLVIFVGSPLEEDERTLVRLGKRLKKNSVAVDVINFGELNENVARLEAFVGAVDSNGNRFARARCGAQEKFGWQLTAGVATLGPRQRCTATLSTSRRGRTFCRTF